MTRSPPLTDKTVRTLAAPNQGNRITKCGELPGFGVRVTAAGAKSFVLNYVIDGRERRMTIGRYPEFSVVAARKRALELRRDVQLGVDPLGERNERRAAPTVSDLWARYSSEHLPSRTLAGQDDERRMWKRYVIPILGGSTKLHDLSVAEIENLRRQVVKAIQEHPGKGIRSKSPSHTPGQARARAVVTSLKCALNLATHSWGWLEKNPAIGVRLAVLQGRERFLSEAEISALWGALAPATPANLCLKFLLLTGARRGETLAARWEEFSKDAEGRWVWRKPSHHTKTRRTHVVPLSPEAAAILAELRAAFPKSEVVFPGRREGESLTDLKRSWRTACKRAAIHDARIHDLRHSFASLLVARQMSLPLIGRLLGHTQVATTQRYAHLAMEPLAQAANIVGHIVGTQTNVKQDSSS